MCITGAIINAYLSAGWSVLIHGYLVFIFITHVLIYRYIISLYFKLHFPIVQYNIFVGRGYNSMMEPDYGNYCYYDKDGYEWPCLGKGTFHDFVVMTDVEDNCLSFYFGFCNFVYPYYINFYLDTIEIF